MSCSTQRDALGPVEVEGEVALVRVDRQEEEAVLPPTVAVEERARGGEAHPVGPLDRLDVQDLGAEHGEQLRHRRARPPAREVEDLQALERQRPARAPTGPPEPVRSGRSRPRLDPPGVLARASAPVAAGRARSPAIGTAAGAAEVAVGAVDEDVAGDELLVLEHGAAVVDLRDRDAHQRRELDDLVGRVASRPGVHRGVPLLRAASSRPANVCISASSSQSGRSIRTRKSWNICIALVLKPTQPSAVGSIDGSSTQRAGPDERRSTVQALVEVAEQVRRDQHRLELARRRPARPGRCAARGGRLPARRGPVDAGRPFRDPAAGLHRGLSSGPRPPIDPHSAWSTNSVRRRVDPRAGESARRDGHDDQRGVALVPARRRRTRPGRRRCSRRRRRRLRRAPVPPGHRDRRRPSASTRSGTGTAGPSRSPGRYRTPTSAGAGRPPAARP